jgi:hypothetical protein
MSDLGEIVSLDDLVEAIEASERRRAHVAVATARIAASGTWAADGYVSMAAWLEHHCRMSHADATRLLREGRFLDGLEAVADAALSGELSASQVGAIRSIVTAPTADLFAEHQHAVVNAITALSLGDTVQVCQQWRTMAEAVVDMPEPTAPGRSWRMSQLDDGTMVGRFVFDPAAAAQVKQAIATAVTWNGADDARSAGMRHADAAFSIMAFFNANHLAPGTPRHRPHVEVHLQAVVDDRVGATHATDATGATCAVTSNGQLLPDWALDAFMCDCVIHRVLRAGSAVLDYGRATRSVPHSLFRAVVCRDGGCRFPGCTRPTAWCDAHHIRWWRNHGETKLSNLVLLCSHHHHLIHRERWVIELAEDGDVRFTAPDGRLLVSEPRGQPTIRPPVAA